MDIIKELTDVLGTETSSLILESLGGLERAVRRWALGYGNKLELTEALTSVHIALDLIVTLCDLNDEIIDLLLGYKLDEIASILEEEERDEDICCCGKCRNVLMGV